MGKLFNAAALISLAILLAGGGFVAYLFGTGRLTAGRLETITAVLRGEVDELTQGEPDQPPEQEQASPQEPRAPSAEEARAARKREHLERLRLERALSDLEAQRRLLDQVMQHVVVEQERLQEEETTFSAQRTQVTEATLDEGFQKELELVSELKPAQAKEHIVRVWRKRKADAVRLIMALDERQATRILGQFTTPEELQIQTDLLEQIRLQGTEGHAESSGKTAGSAPP